MTSTFIGSCIARRIFRKRKPILKSLKTQCKKEGSVIKIDAINQHEANLLYSQKFPNETKDSIKTRFTNKSFSQYEQQQFKNRK